MLEDDGLRAVMTYNSNKAQWKRIRQGVKYLVQENWETMMEEKPALFMESLQSKILRI